MPLLSRRQSTLDALMNDVRNPQDYDHRGNHGLSSTAAKASASTSQLRPHTAQPFGSHLSVSTPGLDDTQHSIHRPHSPPLQQATPATRRFSMLRWRHFSDTQLAATARMHASQEERPPVPQMLAQSTTQPIVTSAPLARDNLLTSSNTDPVASTTPAPAPAPALAPTPTSTAAPTPIPAAAPAIITTAPTVDMSAPPKKQKTPFKRQISKFTSPSKHLHASHRSEKQPRQSLDLNEHPKQTPSWRRSFDRRESKDHLQRPLAPGVNRAFTASAPPPYGDEANSAQALPVETLSVSSAGDRSSSEHVTYATTTTTHTISTTTTLFKLPRRNKKKSLFPLPAKIDTPPENTNAASDPPRLSTSAISTTSVAESPTRLGKNPHANLQRRHTEASRPRLFASPSVSPSHTMLAKSAVAFAAHPGASLFRNDSSNSAHSTHSSAVLAPPKRLGFRDRSSTMGSFGRRSEDMTPATPPTLASARNSTSTSGRTSLGGFLTLSRFRHGSDSNSRNLSPGLRSKSNSFAISREALVVPEREEGDTPGKYLERLQATVSRSLIAGILSKSSDPFSQAVLRSYSRKFPFFGEPIDMSLRKFLLEAELPKETQQVDRVIQAFADRYHECNPGIFQSPDKAYIVAFSLMMLHTDAFNKNNKRKMQKHDYVKNTSGQNVSDDILACFYDNICYTPFIHFDEEVDINGERLLSFKPKKSKLRSTIPDPVRKNSGPIDPYSLICDGKLDMLRPPIKDTINTDDPYTYLGTAGTLDINKLQRAFVNTAILQIISARSRPAAFESQATRDNPSEAAAGVVDLKITKVGLLWRKNAKRKKTRSPWQEWGAILTGSQLYLFKNLNWIKGLMMQQQTHNKEASSLPVIFHPPIQDFKPDALIKADDAVALLDAGYTRHKDAFTLVRHGGQEEVLIAENECEMNEWIALINYAAAFRSAGVRIRGFIGGTEESTPRSRGRLDSAGSITSGQRLDGQPLSRQQTMGPELVQQVLVLRGKIMRQTIVESEREIEQLTNNLETMLRNSRHLLLLAPIQQKTRDEVIHAATRMNAMLKWVRRDIWRTKCHRDILARDLELDNYLNDKAAAPNPVSPPPAVIVRKASGSQRLNSGTSSAVSPLISPQSPVFQAVTGPSAEEFFGKDVFKTPPENARRFEATDDWKMPPLDLNAEQQQQQQHPHRLSVASGAQSLPRKHSTTGMSASSSIYDRQLSYAGSENASRPVLEPSAHSYDNREREALMLARDDLAQSVTATTVSSNGASHAYDFASTSATPESASRPKNRRSLHRTLREARDHPSIHRHRRGKESASTVRSDTSRAGDLVSDNTPVLERSNGKFIVHGKKASVITFGGDWSEEKIRIKREMEARNQSLGTTHDADESGPEANLRRHVESEMAVTDGADGYASDSTAPATSRRLSDTDAYLLRNGHGQSGLPEMMLNDIRHISRFPDAFTLGSQYDDVSANYEDGLDSYFDMGSAPPHIKSRTEEGAIMFSNPTFSPTSEEPTRKASPIIAKGDDIAPDQLPLPSSPPIKPHNNIEETPPFTKYIADDELRQLSRAGKGDDGLTDTHSQAAQA